MENSNLRTGIFLLPILLLYYYEEVMKKLIPTKKVGLVCFGIGKSYKIIGKNYIRRDIFYSGCN